MPTNIFERKFPLPTQPIQESYWVIPGRLLAGEYPGVPYAPEQTRQRLDAFLKEGFNTYINLTGLDEIQDYGEILKEEAGFYSEIIEYFRFPIGDFGLPKQNVMAEILETINSALVRGRKVYYHCYAGIGRTGTVTGCYLINQGYDDKLALQILSDWWQKVPKSSRYPHSPETRQQVEFIVNWHHPAILD